MNFDKKRDQALFMFGEDAQMAPFAQIECVGVNDRMIQSGEDYQGQLSVLGTDFRQRPSSLDRKLFVEPRSMPPECD